MSIFLHAASPCRMSYPRLPLNLVHVMFCLPVVADSKLSTDVLEPLWENLFACFCASCLLVFPGQRLP